MTQTESDSYRIDENNRILMEYCGWKLELSACDPEEGGYRYYDLNRYDDKGERIDSFDAHDESYIATPDSTIPFHDDWNYLMQAWKKVYDEIIHTDSYADFYTTTMDELHGKLLFCLETSNKPGMLLNLAKFITEYNNLNQQ